MKLNDIVLNILSEGVYDKNIFKAVFLSGGPGSGKSFVASKVLTGFGLKVVNSDDAFTHLLKKAGKSLNLKTDYSDDVANIRNKAKELTSTKHDNYTDGRLGLIVDGTGADYNIIKNNVNLLKELGYDCSMIFVNTSLETALDRNNKRERKLPDELITKMWKDVQSNLGKYQSLFGAGNFEIIDNQDNVNIAPLISKLSNKIRKFINAPIKNFIAKQWIVNQLNLKKR